MQTDTYPRILRRVTVSGSLCRCRAGTTLVPLADHIVYLFPARSRWHARQRTDGLGRFVIPNVPVGTYVVRVYGPDELANAADEPSGCLYQCEVEAKEPLALRPILLA
jgi:hypothetical protein